VKKGPGVPLRPSHVDLATTGGGVDQLYAAGQGAQDPVNVSDGQRRGRGLGHAFLDQEMAPRGREGRVIDTKRDRYDPI